MENVKREDAVVLQGKVINVYGNGTARVQLSPSGSCHDFRVADLQAAGGLVPSGDAVIMGGTGPQDTVPDRSLGALHVASEVVEKPESRS